MSVVLPDELLDVEESYIPEELDEILVATDPKDIPPDEGDTEASKLWTPEGFIVPQEVDSADDGFPFGREDSETKKRHKVNHSPAGLTSAHRNHARNLTIHALTLGLDHAAFIHYTQGSSRWDGIRLRKIALKGEYPNYADCSAFAAWGQWQGIAHCYHRPDVVNGEHWRAGYTGTMVVHGIRVTSQAKWMRCDCILYGNPTTEHTATLVGFSRRYNNHMVISHGSEAGPLYCEWNYRGDINRVKRYI